LTDRFVALFASVGSDDNSIEIAHAWHRVHRSRHGARAV
jgi:hypothetical protein